jgi:CBS domain-containing protein
MSKTVKDVMTRAPVTLGSDATVVDAARKMRDEDIGPIVLVDGNQITGIVTDRDIVIRVVAEGMDPATTLLGAVASEELTTLEPSSPIAAAVSLMKQKAIRRLPVVEDGRPIGIVSLGDLAMDRDPESALGDISQAPPNK